MCRVTHPGSSCLTRIQVENVIGGMRGLKAMLWDASVLDPIEVCTLGSPSPFTTLLYPHTGYPLPWIVHSGLPAEASCSSWWQGDHR